jgi:hypothetical protein
MLGPLYEKPTYPGTTPSGEFSHGKRYAVRRDSEMGV